MVKTVDKNIARLNRHKRVRGKISGTAERPRLNVYRSTNNIYAQLIDDVKGVTLCAASSLDKDFEGNGGNKDAARKAAAEAAKAAEKPAEVPKAEQAEAKEQEHLPEITIDDFAKCEMRVAKVLTCERLKESKKLLKFTLFDGERERTILSGIAKWYAPEDLIGKHLCIVANLAPRPMMKGKYVSEGMIVSAEDDEGNVTVLQLPETVKPGAQLC